MKPLKGKTVAQRQADWDARMKAFDPSDVPVLLEPLISFGRRAAQYRLAQLHAKGPDPRIAEALAGWVEERPRGYHGQDTRDFWRLVMKILREIADPRQRRRLEAVRAQVEAQISCFADTILREELPSVLARLGEAPPEPKPIADVQELFAAVYANPDDDAPRAVLADLLLAQGDPRGELISLQLGPPSRASTKRCKALLAAHAKAWTGGLTHAVRKEGLSFARGFLSSVHLGPTPGALDLATCPELATVETLHLASGVPVADGMWQHLRSLTSLTGHAGSVFRSPVPLPRLAAIALDSGFESEALLACTALPALKTLALDSVFEGAARFPFWAAPLGKTVTSLRIGMVAGTAAEWRAWIAAAPLHVTDVSVGLVSHGIRLGLQRVDGGWRAELLLSSHGESLAEPQVAVDGAVDAAIPALAGAGLERCVEVGLAFRENTRGPGWPGTHLPPTDAAVLRLKSAVRVQKWV